jgi:SAM-dependent methyltransferase
MRNSKTSHYSDHYFSWHRPISEFGAWANIDKFTKYIQPDHNVLDFGCGGGYLLKELNCEGKRGIEVNPTAREKAKEIGIAVFHTADEVPDNWADVIISNNALEHTRHPLRELNSLFPKLRRGGLIVFVVPCESIRYKYKLRDINYHLYSWSPMCLGNLFTEAGFHVKESKPYIHKWPPFYNRIARITGRRLFNICCKVYGHLERSWFQVRIVATKS